MFIKINRFIASITLWKIYAWLYLIFVAVPVGDGNIEVPVPQEVADSLLGISSLVAIFAFAYKKPILKPMFWKGTFISGIIVFVIYCTYLDWHHLTSNRLAFAFAAIAMSLLASPAIVAHYKYAFYSSNIWKEKSNQHMDFTVKTPVDSV